MSFIAKAECFGAKGLRRFGEVFARKIAGFYPWEMAYCVFITPFWKVISRAVIDDSSMKIGKFEIDFSARNDMINGVNSIQNLGFRGCLTRIWWNYRRTTQSGEGRFHISLTLSMILAKMVIFKGRKQFLKGRSRLKLFFVIINLGFWVCFTRKTWSFTGLQEVRKSIFLNFT